MSSWNKPQHRIYGSKLALKHLSATAAEILVWGVVFSTKGIGAQLFWVVRKVKCKAKIPKEVILQKNLSLVAAGI